MNMKNLRYMAMSGLVLVLAALAATSCEETNDWSTDSAYNRLFRTSKMAVSPDTETAEVIWNSTPNTDYYVIEVNADSLYTDAFHEGSLIFGKEKDITKSPYTLTGLEANTLYYIRIKSCSAQSNDSKWAYPEKFTFRTKAEQIMNDVASVTGKSAVISWTPGAKITHLLLVSKDSERKIDNLTEEEKEKGEYTLTGLTASTSYTISVYNGDKLRGQKKFKTTENYPDGFTPVNLTADDDPNEVLAGLSGDVVLVIPHSTNIEWAEKVTIPESVTSIVFWGASGGEEQATMKIKSVTAEGTKDLVRFYNLHVDPQGDYMFNLQDVDASINKVLVENCIVEKSKGVIRAKNGNVVRIGEAVIDNCIINGSGAALFAFKESSKAQIPVIRLTNSTVRDIAQQYFYLINDSEITVKDCTLYNIGTGKAFLELSNKDANGSTMNMENTIIAKSVNPDKNIKACNVKGKCTYNNVYVSADCTFDSTMEGTPCSASGELFVDPEAGNFSIKDPMFTANAGDPRWKQ